MMIEFSVKFRDKDEEDLIPGFCRQLILNIQTDIISSIRMDKFNAREKFLLDSKWISWIVKPDHIDMYKVLMNIIDSMIYIERKSTYVICIDHNKKLPGTNTRIDRIARFLDKGNEICRPTCFISEVLNKYLDNINDYWSSYVFKKLNRMNVSEIVVIE